MRGHCLSLRVYMFTAIHYNHQRRSITMGKADSTVASLAGHRLPLPTQSIGFLMDFATPSTRKHPSSGVFLVNFLSGEWRCFQPWVFPFLFIYIVINYYYAWHFNSHWMITWTECAYYRYKHSSCFSSTSFHTPCRYYLYNMIILQLGCLCDRHVVYIFIYT